MNYPSSRRQKSGRWVVYWSPDVPAEVRNFETVADAIQADGTIVKDDHRSLVKRILINGHDIVAKQPRDKNRRLWIRLLTLLRRSEVRYTQETLERLERGGVPALKPVAALEYRRWRFVIDSWLLYFYRPGTPCTRDQYPEVVATLEKLHAVGLRHEDPHVGNFLYDGESVFVLDCKGKSRLGPVSDCNDFILMWLRSPADCGISEFINVDKKSWPYRLARIYGGIRALRQRVKKILRGGRSSRYRASFGDRR